MRWQQLSHSTALRKWFSSRWMEFQRRYFGELDVNADCWKPILDAARRGRVTLIFSSHDVEHYNALALMQYLDGKLRRGVRDGSRGVARNTAP